VKRAILFDLDGTLIDSNDAILYGFSYAFEKFGRRPPEPEKILALVGHPLDVMFKALGVREDVDAWVAAYKEGYRQVFKEKTRLLPQAAEAVKEATTIARLGVVTTKTGSYSKELLEHLGLLRYFDVVVGKEDVHYPKPHPEPILKALHHIGAAPQKSFMVGDTCLDMEAARDAGVYGVGVECGYGEEWQLRQCARHTEKGPLEAVEFIASLMVKRM